MTLEELKAAWDAAVEKLKAAPEDEALKTAVANAEKAYKDAEAASQDDSEDDSDESAWDDKTKAYVAKLRKENATHRNKNKELKSSVQNLTEKQKAILKAAGIESEDEKPEEKVKSLTATSQTLAFRNAILETAVKKGIASDDLEFFEFLIAKATSELEENEELSEDALDEIVKKVGAKGKGSANTSVGAGKEQQKPGASGAITIDQFCAMSISEKSALYVKQPDLYASLLKEAKAKKRLV